MKRVMVDQESGAEIMYPNLYNELGLKFEDLRKYDTPLMGFVGQIATPIEVNFIVVNAFSTYTAILGKPWIDNMGKYHRP